MFEKAVMAHMGWEVGELMQDLHSGPSTITTKFVRL